ncbi:THO complex subunit 1 transcription elongation factor-domain-containing protein [Syncephalis plumigaleata]|nr:THO complex subunit 1 transcription elongation factor-domain-containing protein [Syncephalis plumigaleata]
MSNEVAVVQLAHESHAALRSAIAVALQETHTAIIAPEMCVNTVNLLASNDPRAEPSPTTEYWQCVTNSLQKNVRPLLFSTETKDGSTSDESALADSNSSMNDAQSKTELNEVNRIALDVALREQLMTYLQETDMFKEKFACIDLVSMVAELGWLDPWIPLVYLEEILDMSTVLDCQQWFCYLESRSSRMIAGMPPRGGKSQALLRICNELLRKLAKTDGSEFLGRVMVFLANAFPLSDPSGVNQAGHFNVANTTLYETKIEDMEQVEAASKEKQAWVSGVNSDYEFYHVFWSLQPFFNQPTLLFVEESFGEFRKAVEVVLSSLEKIVNTEHPSSRDTRSSHRRADRKRKRDDATHTTDTMEYAAQHASISSGHKNSTLFYPKYLTHRNLLPLQMMNSRFQRPILVQMLITLNYLTTFLKEEKEKAELVAKQKGRAPEFVLEGDQKLWVQRTRTRIQEVMELTEPHGRAFVSAVRLILRHEGNWIRWKVMGCPPFDKIATMIDEALLKAQEEHANIEIKPLAQPLGTEALSALWEKDMDDQAYLSDPQRRSAIPDPRTYLDDFVKEYPNNNNSNNNQSDVVNTRRTRRRDAFLPPDMPEFYQESRLAKMWRAYRCVATSNIRQMCKSEHGNLTQLHARLSDDTENWSDDEVVKESSATTESTAKTDEVLDNTVATTTETTITDNDQMSQEVSSTPTVEDTDQLPTTQCEDVVMSSNDEAVEVTAEVSAMEVEPNNATTTDIQHDEPVENTDGDSAISNDMTSKSTKDHVDSVEEGETAVSFD